MTDSPSVQERIKEALYPFAQIRTIESIRVGILTITEKWEILGRKESKNQFPSNYVPAWQGEGKVLTNAWDIVRWNDWAIRQDFDSITNGRQSEAIPGSVTAINPSAIFIEPGARLQYCSLNASDGPIYIGKNAEIMEGSFIRGPFSLGESSVVKMGTKIYGATSIGPFCTVGGEIKNSLMFGYSNKGHEGYLGDSVMGEWCNLGAGTSNSNVKNSASTVKTWSRSENKFVDSGFKCGLLMGDYSRAAINSSFNTGTVVGVSCNLFFNGLSSKYYPDFSWGDGTGPRYQFEKAIESISNWKKLKNKVLEEQEIQHLKTIFELIK